MLSIGLVCNVNCVGGRELSLPIASSTTCAEVIVEVKKQLKLKNCANGFGLFESCGMVEKSVV